MALLGSDGWQSLQAGGGSLVSYRKWQAYAMGWSACGIRTGFALPRALTLPRYGREGVFLNQYVCTAAPDGGARGPQGRGVSC